MDIRGKIIQKMDPVGGVSKAGDALIDVVGRYYRNMAFSACQVTPIVLAKLGNDAGIYGAAKLALDAQ